MKKRKLVTISVIAVVACCLIAWCVVLVIEANQPPLYSSGSTGGLIAAR